MQLRAEGNNYILMLDEIYNACAFCINDCISTRDAQCLSHITTFAIIVPHLIRRYFSRFSIDQKKSSSWSGMLLPHRVACWQFGGGGSEVLNDLTCLEFFNEWISRTKQESQFWSERASIEANSCRYKLLVEPTDWSINLMSTQVRVMDNWSDF